MQDIRIICFCEKNNSNNNYFPIEKDKIIKCEYCNYYQHKKCISPMNKSQIYICPICQFALFDPYLKIKYHFFIPNIITNKQQGIFSYNFNIENIVFNMNPPNKHNFLRVLLVIHRQCFYEKGNFFHRLIKNQKNI